MLTKPLNFQLLILQILMISRNTNIPVNHFKPPKPACFQKLKVKPNPLQQ